MMKFVRMVPMSGWAVLGLGCAGFGWSSPARAGDPGAEIYDCATNHPNQGIDPCYWGGTGYAPGTSLTIRVNWDGPNFGLRGALEPNSREWNSFKRLVRRIMAQWLGTGANLRNIRVVPHDEDIGDMETWIDTEGNERYRSLAIDKLPERSILISARDQPHSQGWAFSPSDESRCHVIVNTTDRDWHIVPSRDLDGEEQLYIHGTLLHELGHCFGFYHFNEDDPDGHVMIGTGSTGDIVGVQRRLRGPTPLESRTMRRHYGERPHGAQVYAADDEFNWDWHAHELDDLRSFAGIDWAQDEDDDALTIAWVDNVEPILRIAHTDGYDDATWNEGEYLSPSPLATGVSVAHDGADTALVAVGVGAAMPRPGVVRFEDEHERSVFRPVGTTDDDFILGRPGIEYIASLERWVVAAAGVADADVDPNDAWDQIGQIVLWISDDDGQNWSQRVVVSTEYRSLGDVSLACTDDGECRVGFQRIGRRGHEDDVGKLMTLSFDFDGSGDMAVGRVDTTGTYSTTGPSLAVDDTGEEEVWMMADSGYSWSSPKFRTALGNDDLERTRGMAPGLETGRELALEHATGLGGHRWFAAVPFPAATFPRMWNVLVNSDFDGPLVHGWYSWAEDGASTWFYRHEGRMYIQPTASGPHPWSIGAAQGNVNVIQGRRYRVEFEARVIFGDDPRTIEVIVGQSAPPWYIHSGRREFDIGPEFREYAFEFTARHEDDDQAQLEFDLGGDVNGVVIDNVFMSEVHH